MLALAMLAGCEENTYNNGGNEVVAYTLPTPPLPARDRCTDTVALGLGTHPDCAEHLRILSNGQCTIPEDRIWFTNPFQRSPQDTAETYCSLLELRLTAPNR
ncbi:hypothetical protein KBD34_01370 [Patescibacteria group bacterium]|nr:hypothetical protein [Patescibacteria group bacterium]